MIEVQIKPYDRRPLWESEFVNNGCSRVFMICCNGDIFIHGNFQDGIETIRAGKCFIARAGAGDDGIQHGACVFVADITGDGSLCRV